MIEYNQEKNQLNIKIPISGIKELYTYQKSILAILSHIEIESSSRATIEHLKCVYRLLDHLTVDTEFLSQHIDLIPGYRELSQDDGDDDDDGYEEGAVL